MQNNVDLIDTLWNVKKIIKAFKDAKCIDLIDTLWNVKIYNSLGWIGNMKI